MFPEEVFKEELRFNPTTLAHDLLLTEAITALAERFPGGRIVHGRLLPVDRNRQRRIPDAVIREPRTDYFTAVELELTAKSGAIGRMDGEQSQKANTSPIEDPVELPSRSAVSKMPRVVPSFPRSAGSQRRLAVDFPRSFHAPNVPQIKNPLNNQRA